MSSAACRECGVQVSAGARSCPQCGARPAGLREAGGKLGRVAILAVLGCFVFLLALGAFVDTSPSPELEAMTDAKRAIKSCWKEQGRKSLEPEMARVVAGACEELEADYKRKYRIAP